MTDRETVRTGYDRLGRAYADQRSVDPAERDLLERALAPCTDASWLLDAGCGPGPTLAELADAGRAVGVDLSGGQLAIAAETAPAAALLRGDIAALPFGADRFDAIVALGVLMHVSAGAQTAAIEEFVRVLRPGGRLLVSDGAGRWTGTHPDWLGTGVTMTWAVAGIDAVAAELVGAGLEVVARADAPDELAEDDDARQPLLLAELPA